MTAKGESAAATRWMVVALIALVSAGAAAMALASMITARDGGNVRDALATAPLIPMIAVIVVPFLAVWLVAFAARAPRAATPTSARAASGSRNAPRTDAPPPAASDAAALQLLAVLQQEGRFVDFIEEDLTSYSDDQIGAAVRSIHDGCRSALHERLELHPILAAAEGATVTVERGFDPAAVRVTGNVRGEPPYRGVVRHPGWRSDGVKLPERTGDGDASILAPAEVEVL